MIAIRCTRKLLDLLGASALKEVPDPPNLLGHWYAKPVETAAGDLIAFASETTLLSVAVPACPLEQLIRRFVQRVDGLMSALGFPPEAAEEEISHYEEIAIAKTANRSVLASLNDIAYHYQLFAERDHGGHPPSLLEAELLMSRMPHLTIQYRMPVYVAAELVLEASMRKAIGGRLH